MQSTPASPGKRHHYSPAAQTCTLGVISDSSFFPSSHLPTQSRSASKYFCCRMGNPFQGLEGSSCLTLRNELSKETHMQIKQEILLGRGTWVESRKVRESRRTALLCELQSWVFMVMELVSGLSLASHSDSGSFLVAHVLLSQDGFQ